MNALVSVLGFVAGLVPPRVGLGVYRVPWLARTIRSLLNVSVPPGLQEVRVVSGPLSGARLLLDLTCEKYLWLGTYEPWVQMAIVQHLPAGAWAWDVGGFIGYHALLMHRLGAHVVSLEPDPANRERLRRNLKLNSADAVTLLPNAVGDRRSAVRLGRVSRHASETRIQDDGEIEADMLRLDDLLERFPPPRLVKADIEGAEAAMLRGARRMLHDVRPVWVLGVHGEPGREAISHLQNSRYRVQPIGKGVDVNESLPVGGPAHVLALP